MFVAGAGGAIGRRLLPRLIACGHDVVATTRTPEKLESLRALGAEPLVMDGLDASSVGQAVARTEPEVVVHQMTALAGMGDLKHFDDTFAVTNELRTRGTDHLLAAAEAVGIDRFVAQSYTGWPNAREGGSVKSEEDPLDPRPPAAQARSLEAIGYLEQAVLDRSPHGVVLRYGNFYGPRASDVLVELVRRRKLPIVAEGSGIWSWIHVEDAAAATVAAIERGPAGVYNVVDDGPAPVSEWLPYLAECLSGKPPRRVPLWLAWFAVGEVGVSMMTQIRGSSNAKAKSAARLGTALEELARRLPPRAPRACRNRRRSWRIHAVGRIAWSHSLVLGMMDAKQSSRKVRVAEASSRQKREELAARFFDAVGQGDLAGLVELIAADVAVYGDGGGKAPSWPRPIFGRDRVVRLLLGVGGQARELDVTMRLAEINGQPGAIFFDPAGRLINVMTLDIADGLVQTVRSIINPDKLRHLGPPADVRALLRQRAGRRYYGPASVRPADELAEPRRVAARDREADGEGDRSRG